MQNNARQTTDEMPDAMPNIARFFLNNS